MSNLRHFGLPQPKLPYLNKKKFTIDYQDLVLHYNNEEYCFYKKDKLIIKINFKYNKLVYYKNDLGFNITFYQAYIIYVRLFYQFKKVIMTKNQASAIYPYFAINTNFSIKDNTIIIKAKQIEENSVLYRPNMHYFKFLNTVKLPIRNNLSW
jgi:hypothetical protein